MLDTHKIRAIENVIRSLLKEHDISYRVPPSDYELYQDCINEAARRGYPIGGDQPLTKYLQDSVKYVANASRHYTDRPAQVWLALYLGINLIIDDTPSCFPSEMPSIYLFNDRFVKGKGQGNPLLDALADNIRQASDLFQPVVANLITTSTLDFITCILLDSETASMEISNASRQYPIYQRSLSGCAGTFAFMVFQREIPLPAYVQAIPELIQIINELNDVLSFYKEELAGEDTNQISIMAARNNEPKLKTLKRLAKSVTDLYKRVVKILERTPAARDAFKHFIVGYCDYHFAADRYKLAELNL